MIILIDFIISIFLSFIMYINYFNFNFNNLSYNNIYLSNSFAVPGAIFIFITIMTLLSRFGTFDILSYSMKRTVATFKKVNPYVNFTYGDYVSEKKEDRKKYSNKYLNHLVVGIVFIVISIIFIFIK